MIDIGKPENNSKQLSSPAMANSSWMDRLKSKVISSSEWNQELPPRPALVRNSEGEVFIPKGKVCMISGSGGKGKSFLTLHLAMSIIMSKYDHHTLAITDKKENLYVIDDEIGDGGCLLLYGEDDRHELNYRMKTLFNHKTSYLNESSKSTAMRAIDQYMRVIPMVEVGESSVRDHGFGNENSPAYKRWSELKSVLMNYDYPLHLIVIDPLIHFVSCGIETDNEQAGAFMKQLNELTQLKGNPSVLVIHHAKKSDSSSYRGSSALSDNARWVASLDWIKTQGQDEEEEYEVDDSGNRIVQLKVTKSNSSSVGMVAQYSIPQGGGVVKVDRGNSGESVI